MDVRRVRAEIMSGRPIYDIPLRVTFYARVSTDKSEQASSLENQIGYYTDFIKKNKNWVYVEGYVDEGISGTSTLKRESFNRMILDARQGLFDFIITKEISRFSRSTLDSIKYTQELLQNNVGVFFQSDNINTLDTDSEFRLVVMAGVAQDEVRKLSERLKFGFRQSIKNGRVLGNGRMWGYTKKDGKLEIEDGEAETVRLIFDLYANRQMGMRSIAKYLQGLGVRSRRGNLFNTTTIRNMIRNPKYKGYYCGNKTKSVDYRSKKNIFLDESEWVLYKDSPCVPAIVSEDLWERANALLRSRNAALRCSGAEYNKRYAYSGKIICAEHNASFHRNVMKAQNGEKEIWQCRIYRTFGAKGCTAPTLYTDELNAALADVFRQSAGDSDDIINAVIYLITGAPDYGSDQRELSNAEREAQLTAQKKERLLELQIEGLLSKQEFKERNDQLNGRLAALREKKKLLEEQQKKTGGTPENLQRIRRLLSEELDFTNGIDSALVAAAIEKIVVYTTGDRDAVKLDVYTRAGEKIPLQFRHGRQSFCHNNS